MTIKVVSLNIWWGGNLFPVVLDFLNAQDADIVLLQEVHDGHGANLQARQRSMEVLRTELGYPHDDFAEAFILDSPEGKLPLGNAILSKFPITNRSFEYLYKPTQDIYQDIPEQWPILPRLIQHVQLKVTGKDVNVFNLHGVWDLDGDNDSLDRHRMVGIIAEEVAGKPNVILAGDTNAKSTNPVWQPLEHNLVSVFGNELKSTFNMRRKNNPGYASAAVDLMFVSPEINVISRDCPDVDISDHLPIVAGLDIT